MESSLEKNVLCVSNSYEQKYYLNPLFEKLPTQVKDELKILCVLFTEDVGGLITLLYDDDGNLSFTVSCDEGDLLYDEIGSALKIKQLRRDYVDLLKSLELYYKTVILKQTNAIG